MAKINPTKKMNNPEPEKINDIPVLNSTVTKILSYTFLTAAVTGFWYLFFFAITSKSQFPKFYFDDNISKTILISFKKFLSFEGEYWFVLANALVFTGTISFAYGSGKILLKKILPEYKKVFLGSPYIYIPIIFALGTFSISLLWLILGFSGLLYVQTAYIFTAIGLIIFVYEICKIKLKEFTIKPFLSLPGLEIFLAILLVLWIFSWTCRAFYVESFLDSLVYHLGLPWHYISEGKIFSDPYNSFSYMTQNMEMLFLNPLLLKLEPVTKLLSWFFWCCLISFIYGCVKIFSNNFFGLFAAVLFAFFPATYWQATVSKNDNALAFYLLGSYATITLFFVREKSKIGKKENGQLLFLSGTILGCAIGTKYSGLIPFAQILGILFLYLLTAKKSMLETVKQISLFSAGVFVTFFPWAIKNIFATGNPVYPFLNNFFHANLIRPWHKEIYTESGLGLGWGGYVEFFKYLLALENTDYGRTLGPLGAFLIFLPVAGFIKNKFVRWLGFMFVSGWILYSLFTLTFRYQLAYLGLAAILIGIILFFYFRDSQKIKILLTVILISGLFWKITRMVWLHEAVSSMESVIMGIVGQINYVTGDPAEVQKLYSMYAVMDKELPENAKILIMGEQRIYKIPRRFIANCFLDEAYLYDIGKNIKTAGELKQKLLAEGITHIFIDLNNWNAYLKTKNDPAFSTVLQEFFSSQVQAIKKSPDGRYYLFQV